MRGRDDLAEAAKWAAVAKARSPRDPYPYADLAELYTRQGMYAQAIAECKAILQLGQDAAGIYYLLGQAQTASPHLKQQVVVRIVHDPAYLAVCPQRLPEFL